MTVRIRCHSLKHLLQVLQQSKNSFTVELARVVAHSEEQFRAWDDGQRKREVGSGKVTNITNYEAGIMTIFDRLIDGIVLEYQNSFK